MAKTFPNFPTSFGNIRVSLAAHAGPASYTQVTSGTIPITGGDTVEAAEFGLKYINFLVAQNSDTGAYVVQAIPVTDSDNGVAGTTYRLKWIVAATGAEAAGAANLSAQTVRLLAFGAPL